MAVSKEQWEEIEKQLSGSWGRVELVCDGYKINAAIVNVSPLKLGIAVYVDGVTLGEWIFNEEKSEIPLKFHQEKKRFAFKGKYRDWLLKASKNRVWTKEERAKYAADAARTHSHWLPYWTNPTSFCRHIRKTCTSIELVKIGY
ncbi:hypothetical protein [Sideroxydans lithotrophicus]|uniref:Uncharacterized protein n=1 Tax=Sideroxydans lithotrophicus (strain ES-1) TaxID=580332 RepID=D5CUB8_SIDLE|nr:hypothetical protein [Sideroxydans lithotrophicus]ADE10453.1 conserved hypothetical protein [Sideroxydans lithotrophicus ES-1]